MAWLGQEALCLGELPGDQVYAKYRFCVSLLKSTEEEVRVCLKEGMQNQKSHLD